MGGQNEAEPDRGLQKKNTKERQRLKEIQWGERGWKMGPLAILQRKPLNKRKEKVKKERKKKKKKRGMNEGKKERKKERKIVIKECS